jgi:hypothetical protein
LQEVDDAQMCRSGGANACVGDDDEGTSFLFGIGIGASPTPAWHLRLEFQSFPIEEELLVASSDTTVDTFLLEARYRFGR